MAQSNATSSGITRRHWLIAAPTALVALGFAARRWWTARSPDATATVYASLVGQRLDRWTVVRVHPMHLGAVPVVLSTNDGDTYQVDVLARDPDGPHGVANTDKLSLFVVNSSRVDDPDGRRATDEEQGLGAMTLAQSLATEPLPRGLLTHRERNEQHPDGAFAVPLA